jgi:hypothetical protein
LPDSGARDAMMQGLDEVRHRLRPSDREGSASERAARAVLTVLGQTS